MQSGGLLLFYHLHQYVIRMEMHELIKDDHTAFEKLFISLSEFQKSKINDSEIFLDGKMYDIKSVSIVGNKVSLLAINDTEEKNIIDKIKKLIMNEGSKEDIPYPVVKFLYLSYIPPVHNHSLFIEGISNIDFASFCVAIVSRATAVFSPPPEIN